MFNWNPFKSHAGKSLKWKIECDDLNRFDIAALSAIISKKVKFYIAYCPPTNSIFVQELTQYLNRCNNKDSKTILIIDDVLTTGKSMHETRKNLILQGAKSTDIKGVVVFSRNKCPHWITPIFQLNKKFNF